MVLLPATTEAQGAASARDLSLKDALTAASVASEVVKIAEAEVTRADADIARARSERWPQVSAAGSYTRTLRSQFSGLSSDDTATPPACDPFTPNPDLGLEQRIPLIEQALACQQSGSGSGLGTTFARLPFGRANQWSLGVSVNQALYSGGRITAQLSASQSAKDAATLELDAARAQQTLTVAEAYYAALLADRLVQIVETTIEQSERTLEQTEVSFRVGSRPEFDVLRARVAVDALRPVLIQQQAARELAQLRLKQLLDLPPESALTLTDQLDTPAAATIDAAAELPLPGVDERVPVREAVTAVAAQESALRIVRSQTLPGVSLNGQFQQYAYPDAVVPAIGDFVSNWTVGVGVQVPLFTGGRLAAERAAAEATLSQARLRVTQARELTALDTRDARLSADAAAASWLASASTAEQAAAAFRIAEIRFREGVSSQLELSDARLQLQQAQVSRAQAERDFRLARLRLQLLPRLPLSTNGGLSSTGSASPPVRQQSPQRPGAPTGTTTMPGSVPVGSGASALSSGSGAATGAFGGLP